MPDSDTRDGGGRVEGGVVAEAPSAAPSAAGGGGTAAPSAAPSATGGGCASSPTIISSAPTPKRAGYITWDSYFMSLAFLSAMRSKDPHTQVGAVIVDDNHRILSVGYNGLPIGISDDALPWSRASEDPLETKYNYVCHAEMNAVLNKNAVSVRGGVIYCTLFPCCECTKLLIQSGITEVVYNSDKYHDTVSCTASRRMLDLVGITYREFAPPSDSIVIRFR